MHTHTITRARAPAPSAATARWEREEAQARALAHAHTHTHTTTTTHIRAHYTVAHTHLPPQLPEHTAEEWESKPHAHAGTLVTHCILRTTQRVASVCAVHVRGVHVRGVLGESATYPSFPPPMHALGVVPCAGASVAYCTFAYCVSLPCTGASVRLLCCSHAQVAQVLITAVVCTVLVCCVLAMALLCLHTTCLLRLRFFKLGNKLSYGIHARSDWLAAGLLKKKW